LGWRRATTIPHQLRLARVDLPVDGGFSMLGPDQGRGPRYWIEQASGH
jgi:hypothetical protein